MTRFRVRRTPASGPPAGLLFGEIAYSDADQLLHVGRVAPTDPPASFGGNPTDYGPAIATLTTDLSTLDTTTGEQATAIASFASALTTQAAAIETLEETQFSGAYGDLTGLPTLFSGAYGDLAGKPAIPYGFTYSQSAEPSSPDIGATWQELSSGLTIGLWMWTGSLWASMVQIESGPVASVAASGAGDKFDGPILGFRALITSITYKSNIAAGNATNFYTVEAWECRPQAAIGGANVKIADMGTTNGANTLTVATNFLMGSNDDSFRIALRLTATGAPSNGRHYCTARYRRVR